MQVFATVLSDVCYRLHGTVVSAHSSGGINRRHHLQELFDRRLRNGQCFRTPCLGWSEFTCSYWGPFRDHKTEVDDTLREDIPSMLSSVWGQPIARLGQSAVYAPIFRQDVKIEQGVLRYAVPKEWLAGTDREEIA